MISSNGHVLLAMILDTNTHIHIYEVINDSYFIGMQCLLSGAAGFQLIKFAHDGTVHYVGTHKIQLEEA